MLDKIRELYSLKPTPILLGLGRDGHYYYIYYAGMGSQGFHKVADEMQSELCQLIHDGKLYISNEDIEVGVHAADLDRFVMIKFKKLEISNAEE